MFQHRNYEVASSRRTTKVIRRYSDFVWLLDCLHKRYPFRQLPLLPPKRVGSKYPPHSILPRIENS
jgi:sorting nexin-8